jgi:hypothetical protein
LPKDKRGHQNQREIGEITLASDPVGGESPDQDVDKGPIKEIRELVKPFFSDEKVAKKNAFNGKPIHDFFSVIFKK